MNRSEAARLGGLARAKQFTPESQAAAGKARASAFTAEYQSSAGKISYAKLVRQFGRAGAMERLSAWRRANPSKLEKQVMAWLDEHQIAYQREANCAEILVDFLLDDGTTVIEVDGYLWHTLAPLHGEDRAGRDAIHDMALIANGYRVIRLAEAAIKDGSAFTQLEGSL